MPTYSNGDNEFIRGGLGAAAPPPDPDPEPGINQSTDPQTGVIPRYRVAPYYMIDPATNRPILGERGQSNNDDIKGGFVPVTGSRLPTFTYLGGFRLTAGTFGVSSINSTKFGFSVQNGVCWICGDRNANRAVGSFTVPPLEQNPDDAMAPNQQPFIWLDSVSSHHLSGVFHDLEEDWLLVSNSWFYGPANATTEYMYVMRPNGTEKQPVKNLWSPAAEWSQQVSSGQVVKTPAWVLDRVGHRLYMHPEHWLNNINRLCVGPGLTGFTPRYPEPNASMRVYPIMYYPYLRCYGQHGSGKIEWIEAEGKWYPRQRRANPLSGRTCYQEVSFFYQPSNAYISIGCVAGLETGQWYGPDSDWQTAPPGYTHITKGMHFGTPSEMPQGRDASGFAISPGTQSFQGSSDWTNYYQIHDVDEIFNAQNPWDPEPVEWGPVNPAFPVNPGQILGAHFDTDTNRLYLMTWGCRVRVYQVS